MRLFILLCGLSISVASYSQEQLGLRIENYAGVSGLSLNPTSQLSNPLSWDLNLAGAGFFFGNNYAYISQTNTLELIRNRRTAEFMLRKDVEQEPSSNTYLIDFYTHNRKSYAAINEVIMGPSLALNIGELHSVGVFTNIRISGSSHNIPEEFTYYDYDSRANYDDFRAIPFEGTFMSWSEIGLNYAISIPGSDGHTGLGINLKYLTGYESAFVENDQGWTHTKLPNNTISIGQPVGRFGLTTSNIDGNGFEKAANGQGFGFDIGFMTTINEYEGQYKLKLGASLLDIGQITFNRNTQAHSINIDSSFLINIDDYDDFNKLEDLDDIIGTFSTQALGDPEASLTGDEYTMSLPTALSVQADYSFTENIFLNATLIQRVPLMERGPHRGNLLALTPRYEDRWFSVSFPVSVYNWDEIRLGLAARLGYVVIGTDNLGSMVGNGNYHGTDFYIALKVNPFDLGLNAGGGKGKRHFGGRGKVKCYDF